MTIRNKKSDSIQTRNAHKFQKHSDKKTLQTIRRMHPAAIEIAERSTSFLLPPLGAFKLKLITESTLFSISMAHRLPPERSMNDKLASYNGGSGYLWWPRHLDAGS